MKSQLRNSRVVRTWSKINPIKKAIMVGIITIIVYLTVVVFTTPPLEPKAAVNAALH